MSAHGSGTQFQASLVLHGMTQLLLKLHGLGENCTDQPLSSMSPTQQPRTMQLVCSQPRSKRARTGQQSPACSL